MTNPKNKIRIVFLIGHLGKGGSERQLYLLLKYINQRQFECYVAVFNPSPNATYERKLKDIGVKVCRIPESVKKVYARIFFIYKLVKKISPAIIHSWSFYSNPYAGIVGMMAKIPVRLGSCRNHLQAELRKINFVYGMLSILAVQKIVVNSNDLKKEFIKKSKLLNKKILVINNCVIQSDISEKSYKLTLSYLQSLGIGTHDILIGTVGNIREQKNHRLFLNGVSKLLDEYPRIKAVIVGHPLPGEEALVEKLELIVKNIGAEKRIFFTGFRDDIKELMRRFDIFCLTSKYEGMPNVVLEAMASSTPVISTRVQGVEDIIDNNKNGIVLRNNSHTELSDSIKNLIDNKEYANCLGKLGKEKVINAFNYSRITKDFEKIYHDLL